MNKDPEEDLSLPLWLSLTFSDAIRYWHECLGLSQPMRSGFWFISKTDRIFSSGFTLYSFTSTKQMKRFLGSLWDEPKPKPKAVPFLHAFLSLPGLSVFSRKTQSFRGFGIFSHCKHFYCITWAIHRLQLPLKHLLKKKWNLYLGFLYVVCQAMN